MCTQLSDEEFHQIIDDAVDWQLSHDSEHPGGDLATHLVSRGYDQEKVKAALDRVRESKKDLVGADSRPGEP